MQRTATAATVLGVLGLLGGAYAPAEGDPNEVPLGHRNFYPSADRPVGWRGDGTGAFPGATPVDHWREGAVEQKTLVRTVYGREQKRRFWVFSDKAEENVVWKVPMPGYSNSQPVVVGDRVFATADPSFVVCLDCASGKVLWKADLDPFEAQGLPGDEARKAKALSDITYCIHAITASLVGNYHRLGCHRVEPMTRAYLRERMASVGKLLDRADALGLDAGVAEAKAQLAKARAAIEELPSDEARARKERKVASGAIARIPVYMVRALRKHYGVLPFTHFDGWTGFSRPTPVSDGRRLYVSMGQGQVACYELGGQRVWRRHFPYPERGTLFKLSESSSPLLLGDVLIVQKYFRLLGLDKRTGQTLWEVEEKDAQGGQVHAAVTLTGGARAVVTPRGKVIRAADGKELADLGLRQLTGPSLVAWDDVVYFSNAAAKSGPKGMPVAVRLIPDGPDKVKAEVLWKREKEAYGVHGRRATDLYHAGRIYRPNSKDANVAMIDAQTGRTLAEKLPGLAAGEGPSPILAGDLLVSTRNGGCPYIDASLRYYAEEGGIVQEFSTVQLTGPVQGAKPVASYLGGRNKPRMSRLETYLPALYRRGLWSTSGATPVQFGYGNAFAQGNRVFLLSASHLYCLGDPGAAYDWNPASRPKDIARQLSRAGRPSGG